MFPTQDYLILNKFPLFLWVGGCKGKMWPSYVQGPVAQTLLKNVTITNLEGTKTFDICIFGELHYTIPCDDKAFDVKKSSSGAYRMVEGINPELWTISRLLYMLATLTEKKIEYFFELPFKKIRSHSKRAISMTKLLDIFRECIGPSKEDCQFSTRLMTHAIDYRGNFDNSKRPGFGTVEKDRLFALAVLKEDYSLVKDILDVDVWELFMKEESIPSNDRFPNFDQLTLFRFIVSLSETYHAYLAENDQRLVDLIMDTLQDIYPRDLNVPFSLKTYLGRPSTFYFGDFVEGLLSIMEKTIPKFEKIFTEVDFPSTVSVAFAFDIFIAFRYTMITCRRIIANNHPSTRMVGQRIVSKAAIQLEKCKHTFFEHDLENPISELFIEWIDSWTVADYMTCYTWTTTFPLILKGRLEKYEAHPILQQFFAETNSFMDIPAIARMFAYNSTLKVFYVGENHRKNMARFFEFCGISTTTTSVKKGKCLELTDETKRILTKAI